MELLIQLADEKGHFKTPEDEKELAEDALHHEMLLLQASLTHTLTLQRAAACMSAHRC